jgi:hypothetical protein
MRPILNIEETQSNNIKGCVILPALGRGVSHGCLLDACPATASLTCCATQQRVCCGFGSVVSCHVFLGFLWLLDVSYVWMSSLIFLCQPTVGCHDVLCQHILFEAKGCGNTPGVGTCDDQIPLNPS